MPESTTPDSTAQDAEKKLSFPDNFQAFWYEELDRKTKKPHRPYRYTPVFNPALEAVMRKKSGLSIVALKVLMLYWQRSWGNGPSRYACRVGSKIPYRPADAAEELGYSKSAIAEAEVQLQEAGLLRIERGAVRFVVRDPSAVLSSPNPGGAYIASPKFRPFLRSKSGRKAYEEWLQTVADDDVRAEGIGARLEIEEGRRITREALDRQEKCQRIFFDAYCKSIPETISESSAPEPDDSSPPLENEDVGCELESSPTVDRFVRARQPVGAPILNEEREVKIGETSSSSFCSSEASARLDDDDEGPPQAPPPRTVEADWEPVRKALRAHSVDESLVARSLPQFQRHQLNPTPAEMLSLLAAAVVKMRSRRVASPAPYLIECLMNGIDTLPSVRSQQSVTSPAHPWAWTPVETPEEIRSDIQVLEEWLADDSFWLTCPGNRPGFEQLLVEKKNSLARLAEA